MLETLLIGRTISHYKILDKLGEGGMGEVYRAEDTSLKREVAIKVLPEQFTRDPERLARFEREAQLLASLNHPNIAAIYGLETADGVRFLVLELVEGETLAQRLTRGPLPVEEALELCHQIAEGLEGAHENDVIHRDLKPANVNVTPEGKVKVLDFGLAKAMEAELSEQELANSPAITAEMTRAGSILGTAGYMSPEQARGKPVDKRTDIWAFGCVLYECLTGTQLFSGETASDCIAKVLQREPDWEVLPRSTPWRVRDLLRRCLEKDPYDRLHHIADARIEVRQAQTGSTDPTLAQVAPVADSTSWRRGAILGVSVGLVVSAAAFSLWYLADDSQPIQPTVARLSIVLPDGATLRPRLLALSPDGSQLVYPASRGETRQLYVRALGQLESKPIPYTEGAEDPFISPDGKWVGFFSRDEQALKKVSLMGGRPKTLCEGVRIPRGGSWGQDGTIVFGQRPGLWRVSDGGGTPKELTRVSGFHPRILPGGKAVVFSPIGEGGWSIGVLSLETGEEKILIQRGWYPRYSPTGHLIYALDGRLLAAPFDLETLTVTGDSTPVLEGLWTSAAGEQYSVSRNGTLAYVPAPVGSGSALVWVDRRGDKKPVTEIRRDFESVRFSPDGRRLAVRLRSSTGAGIWIYEIARGILSPLTKSGGGVPIWSPDGTRLAFRRPGSPPSFSWMAADGSGKTEPLTAAGGGLFSRSPDGKVLAFVGRSDSPDWDIWLLPLGGELQPFLATESDEHQPAFSPDGRWIAFTSNRSGRHEVYVKRYLEGGGIQPISIDGGAQPLWAHSGKELFYRNGQKVMVVRIQTVSTLKAEAPRLLFNYPEGSALNYTSLTYDIAPDDQRFVFIQRGMPTHINIVQNWFEELKQLVPTGQ